MSGLKNLPHNHLIYPNNIFEPRQIIIDDKKYKLYLTRFDGLYSLYNYLKSNPHTNNETFPILLSETMPKSRAGKPYAEALEDLIKQEGNDYKEFLRLSGSITGSFISDIDDYKRVLSPVGAKVNIPAYISNSPYCFEKYEINKVPKFIKIYILMSYRGYTSKEQIINRAVIIANIIKALENDGYSIDLEAFELSTLSNEIEQTIVKIKNYGENMRMSDLYKTLCHVEFFRRILFRVLETLDLEESWGNGYGRKCDEEFTRKFLNIGENDIYFDQPSALNIRGFDLADDFENAINCLNLSDIIDIQRAKSDFEKEQKRLKLK